jgi:hypothetical protein
MEEATPQTRAVITAMLEQLVRALLFVDAAGFKGKISGNSGFDTWFQAQGPRDRHGRSLRELELNSRLFRYPMSYVVYSDAFDALPPFAKEYMYRRIAEILRGEDTAVYSDLSAEDRKAVLEILTATKPEFARIARGKTS